MDFFANISCVPVLLRLQWVRVAVVWTFLLSSIFSLLFLPLSLWETARFRCWLVGCFGFIGPLRQYVSLYRAISQRQGERRKKEQMRVKMSKQPQPAPTASAVGPCPTVVISWLAVLWLNDPLRQYFSLYLVVSQR